MHETPVRGLHMNRQDLQALLIACAILGVVLGGLVYLLLTTPGVSGNG